ncbi:hypothetical protein F2Q69_00017920 [Brassica cretica]|uniref:Uncharacterized protein n=1 Tax=Brassica cretica TaxID=69181 RepID=A0A8S9QUC9_BRACR|nr:hypothetical protein F2Q69_00017920 [Brassica cretica]
MRSDLEESDDFGAFWRYLDPVTSVCQSPLVLQEALEIEPSRTPEIVPPKVTGNPHHRDRDVETSPDQEDPPGSRPGAPSCAAFFPRRSARVAHAPPPPPPLSVAAVDSGKSLPFTAAGDSVGDSRW